MLRPVGKRLIVQLEKNENITKSGIILNNDNTENTETAIVLEIGNLENIKIEKQDRIIFNKYNGIKVVNEGNEYYIVNEEDVICIVE